MCLKKNVDLIERFIWKVARENTRTSQKNELGLNIFLSFMEQDHDSMA